MASEAARSAKKSYSPWRNGRTQKITKKFEKTKIFSKTSKNTDLVALGAAESIKKEGSGRGPESDLVEDSMFF